jgi:hypothetical protein
VFVTAPLRADKVQSSKFFTDPNNHSYCYEGVPDGVTRKAGVPRLSGCGRRI